MLYGKTAKDLLYEAEEWKRKDGVGRDFVFDSCRGVSWSFFHWLFPFPETIKAVIKSSKHRGFLQFRV
jgi:hypothetical protein